MLSAKRLFTSSTGNLLVNVYFPMGKYFLMCIVSQENKPQYTIKYLQDKWKGI